MVPAGQAVGLHVARCSSDNDTRIYTMARSLVSDEGSKEILLPATSASIASGCHPVVSAINVIPVCTPPGRYHVEGTSEIHGTYRAFLVKWRSAPFMVSEALNNASATCKP